MLFQRFFKEWQVRKRLRQDYGPKLASVIISAKYAAFEASRTDLKERLPWYFFDRILWSVQYSRLEDPLKETQRKFAEVWEKRSHVPLRRADVLIFWSEVTDKKKGSNAA